MTAYAAAASGLSFATPLPQVPTIPPRPAPYVSERTAHQTAATSLAIGTDTRTDTRTDTSTDTRLYLRFDFVLVEQAKHPSGLDTWTATIAAQAPGSVPATFTRSTASVPVTPSPDWTLKALAADLALCAQMPRDPAAAVGWLYAEGYTVYRLEALTLFLHLTETWEKVEGMLTGSGVTVHQLLAHIEAMPVARAPSMFQRMLRLVTPDA